ncbi:MAG TPA: thioredoxin family protein, partial [Actinopolymorphaceae bacterium]|nr:thioredoxin family protein [Actinopolymorphaceae bacterium]
MTVGIVVLVTCLLIALGLQLLRRRYDGRFRQQATGPRTTEPATSAPARPPMTAAASSSEAGSNGTPAAPSRMSERTGRPALRLAAADLGTDLGERATLVQFSSAFCAPCRATRQLLRDIAAKEPGITYAEIDAESHLGLVRRLHILRTPTVLVLDADG